MNIQDWFPLGWTGWIFLQSKGLSNLLQHHSSKASVLRRSAFFIVQLSQQQMLAIWSLVPLPFLKPAWTSGSSQFMYCWSLAWRTLSITLLACEMCSSSSILWHCLSLGLEWKLTFSSPVATAEFSKFAGILSAALSQHHLSGIEIAQLEFHHLH